MKRLLISAAIAALPGMAMADAKADEIARLKAQMQKLQQQMAELQKAVEAATAPAGGQKAAAAAGGEDANAELKERVANMELKVDKLNTASTDGPIAGLSVTGYLDPTYIYNRNNNSSGFQFLNHQNVYAYSNSTFGDVYLDIKKTFGVGPTAPSAEITIMPNRGSGNTLLDGGSGNNIINTAVINFPLSDTWTFNAGLMNSFGGYEVQQSNQMLTLTHGLLYDFSDPGSYIGAGFNWSHDVWAWKFLLANEQYRTHANLANTGNNASTGNPQVKSNNTPTFTARVDYTWSSALDLGGSFNAGRQTLLTGNACAGGFGYLCGSADPYSNYFFTEADASYTLGDIQYNAELDYGQQQKAAWNGGSAQWYGVSLLGHRKWMTDSLGKMGATLRYDYLNNSKNGGGGGGVALGSGGFDGVNGFGVDPACLASGAADCKGANRMALTAALLFFPTDQFTLKFEYRHDWASQAVFQRNDGSMKKSNDMLGAQAVYTF
ncbi:DUF3138 family protein [Chromobacterium violaceum]|uniref:DUF3138 domain-containing protein n=1 Tax=Chromobacterium violaceum (strain ATCC 12472 / DSM 30191 / JCM 1249 / CCUG 213 / NBRC 12614 / NCIMB 9131 / NCTC 9757 / MK) TaxID=243365 RepID=Q7NWM3_CHRVO|nr:DUF3138 family protein [Chromobacterium violaceum]AAQ59632.1 hypothetical protein CV_1960 [Chromobacterium violaceum ATCC 12472]SUX83975.1 Protein of uncharacterised function (DUF3138) [Chromobacterium violaceum]